MQALVIAHDHLSDGGLIGRALENAGYSLTEHLVVPKESFTSPNVPTEFPDPTRFDLVVSLGAPWSVYDTATIGRWVEDEQRLLLAADEAEVPVLGVCFGGQLLAAAHGGSVILATTPEIGWTSVDSDDDSLIEPGPWFEWHFDRWTLPPGAREIARNQRASQAFALRRNLAVQFHPEVDERIVAGWIENGGRASAIANGVHPDDLIGETIVQADAAADRAQRLVQRFLTQIARIEG